MKASSTVEVQIAKKKALEKGQGYAEEVAAEYQE